MNILMALSQLEVTGAEVYAVTLSNELIKRGHNITIVSDTLTKETTAEYRKIEFNKRGLFQRIKQVKNILHLIKEKDIHVVHAHSRASSWSCEIACKIAGIPLITTTHGRQPVHFSRKLFKAFGKKTIAVCENVKEHLIDELGVKKDAIMVLRNPIDSSLYSIVPQSSNTTKIISIIGRLSGPKGEVTYQLIRHLINLKNVSIQIIGGKTIPEKFEEFKNNEKIKFLGYINDVPEKIKNSDLVIGAGRVAVETILSGKPLIAVGEAEYIGLVTVDNIEQALHSNFGDINPTNKENFEWNRLLYDVEHGFIMPQEKLLKLKQTIKSEFDIHKITDKLEIIYDREYVLKKKYDIPVIMYHRVIRDINEGGIHGIYVTIDNFEKHLKYLKENNYQTVTFKDLTNNKYKHRFDKNNKFVILTFDDGYEDNYKYAFPLLKKYGFTAVIFLLSHLDYNKWDVDVPTNPEKKFSLMNYKMIKEMEKYGIEFGGHTKTHPKLATLSYENAAKEIYENKEFLEKKLGHPLTTFAYPYGNLNDNAKSIVKNIGYQFAVATDSGDICFSTDLFQIRRIGIFSTNSLFTFKRKVSGRYNFIKIKREQKEQNRSK